MTPSISGVRDGCSASGWPMWTTVRDLVSGTETPQSPQPRWSRMSRCWSATATSEIPPESATNATGDRARPPPPCWSRHRPSSERPATGRADEFRARETDICVGTTLILLAATAMQTGRSDSRASRGRLTPCASPSRATRDRPSRRSRQAPRHRWRRTCRSDRIRRPRRFRSRGGLGCMMVCTHVFHS